MTRVVTFEPGIRSLGPAVVAIGVFDGVHLGHQALVSDAVAMAKDAGVSSVVLTFDRDPDRVVIPDRAAPQLLELEDKVRWLSDLRPDAVLIVPFDRSLAAMTPEVFIAEVLLKAMDPVTVAVGHDFCFGTAASGNVDTLSSAGLVHGFKVHAHELLHVGGGPVTSTRIRRLLAEGDVRSAADLLGRRHFVSGAVVHGRGEGHALGVPTANIAVHSWTALPADGVYAAVARVGGEYRACAVSVGLAPTFPAATARLEVHIIDYDGPELYGTRLSVEFVSRIRGQVRFDSGDELTARVREDIQIARRTIEDSCL